MTQPPDHFKHNTDGPNYAGDHLLLELWGAKMLNDVNVIRRSLEASAAAAGATILHSHFHRFGDGGGISGVTLLAESHITIHTWPERGYAAIDIFMCGECDPRDCLAVLEAAFRPSRIDQQLIRRGFAARLTRSRALPARIPNARGSSFDV